MNFLKLLRKKATTRGQQFHNGNAPVYNLEELLFRSTELGGETGEVLEAIKKLARMMRGMKGGAKDAAEAKKAIEEEIADVLISLDRVAEFFDIDIEEATKKKFNKTSKQKGLTIRFKLDKKTKNK